MKEVWTRWSCRRLRARLVDLAEGTLGAHEREATERHVEGCDRCAEALGRLRAAPAVLRRTSTLDRDEAEWLRQRREIMRLIGAEGAPRRSRPPALLREPERRGMPWSAGLMVATAVLIAIVGYARFEATFRPAIQLGGASAPVPNDIGALEPETVAALADVVEVIAPPGADALGLEHLSDEELSALEEWLGNGLV
ncbi:MAG: anti-sigma factor family protein [Candidatus Binatia bacterium]